MENKSLPLPKVQNQEGLYFSFFFNILTWLCWCWTEGPTEWTCSHCTAYLQHQIPRLHVLLPCLPVGHRAANVRGFEYTNASRRRKARYIICMFYLASLRVPLKSFSHAARKALGYCCANGQTRALACLLFFRDLNGNLTGGKPVIVSSRPANRRRPDRPVNGEMEG